MNERYSFIDPQGSPGLSHVLNIKTPQSNPDAVRMTCVQPTIDVNMQGYAKIYDPANTLFNLNVISLGNGTNASIDEPIITPGHEHTLTSKELVFSLGYSLRIIALSYDVHIEDPTGTLLMRTYRVKLNLVHGSDWVPFYHATHQIRTKPTEPDVKSWYFAYPGDWVAMWSDPMWEDVGLGSLGQIRTPIIPPEWRVEIGVYTNCLPSPHSTFFCFPVNSTIDVRILALQIPTGAPIPNFWE